MGKGKLDGRAAPGKRYGPPLFGRGGGGAPRGPLGEALATLAEMAISEGWMWAVGERSSRGERSRRMLSEAFARVEEAGLSEVPATRWHLGRCLDGGPEQWSFSPMAGAALGKLASRSAPFWALCLSEGFDAPVLASASTPWGCPGLGPLRDAARVPEEPLADRGRSPSFIFIDEYFMMFSSGRGRSAFGTQGRSVGFPGDDPASSRGAAPLLLRSSPPERSGHPGLLVAETEFDGKAILLRSLAEWIIARWDGECARAVADCADSLGDSGLFDLCLLASELRAEAGDPAPLERFAPMARVVPFDAWSRIGRRVVAERGRRVEAALVRVAARPSGSNVPHSSRVAI